MMITSFSMRRVSFLLPGFTLTEMIIQALDYHKFERPGTTVQPFASRKVIWHHHRVKPLPKGEVCTVSKSSVMLRNYLLVTFRNLFRNGFYSVINISGLAIGIACSILILLWVTDELSYDKFHPKADRLYQVWVNAYFDGKINSWTSLPLPSYEELKTADANIVHSLVTDW